MKLSQTICAAVLATALVFAQQGPTPQPGQVEAQAANVQGVYGKIKDVKEGDKIVVDVENGKDRSYSLATDPKTTVSVAEGLAIGDKVKIIESKQKGRKSVQIVRDVREDARGHGERARDATDRK